MTPEEIFKSLHQLETKVLLAFGDAGQAVDADLVAAGAVGEAQLRTVVQWQLAKGGIEVASEDRRGWVELTDVGRQIAADGVMELRLVAALREAGPTRMPELTAKLGGDQASVGMAVGALKKCGAVSMDKGLVTAADGADLAEFEALEALLRAVGEKRVLLDGLGGDQGKLIEANSRKRGQSKGMFRLGEDVAHTLRLTDVGRRVRAMIEKAGLRGDEIGQLTPAMLADGSWKGRSFRRYNIALAPPRQIVGKRNGYREFLDFVKSKLIGLGFQEMTGELVESEFWNMDALFMPQFHSARDIHDAYFITEPTHAREIEQPFEDNVAAAHENGGGTGSAGWRYPFDRRRTRRLLLRTQGTVLSVRALAKAKVPGKYFGIARCFRYDTVDASHAPDFFQCEGIVVDPSMDFPTLLGLLQLFAVEVARSSEVQFVPDYFPFTEPSVEVRMKHPVLGWMELGGAGIFRPEVVAPQGLDCPVIAWGLGLDRMAMVALGINDIRELFSNNAKGLNLVRDTVARL
jgi:phenylalanyl-tRNA synthetase alpha chain